MLNLVNELRLYAEDCFAVRGSNPYSTTLSQAADRIRELAEWKNMSACEACATIPSVMEYVKQLEQERDELKDALDQFRGRVLFRIGCGSPYRTVAQDYQDFIRPLVHNA